MNDLDREIKSILNKKLDIPKKYDDMIYNTLSNLPETNLVPIARRNKFKLSLATAVCALFLATGVVFAEEITEFIKYIFNYSKGIYKAIENGYIENINVQTIKSNGTVITAENFLMDDFNLSFTFKVDLENEELLENTSKIEFLDMIITDEAKNILYCGSEEKFNEYCKNNNLDYVYGKVNDKYISAGMNKFIKNKENNQIEIIYNLYADKFPKSKKLFIDVSKIKCITEENNNSEVILEGNWNIEFDVPEKFYDRECAVYTVTSCSESSLNVTDMTVYSTGTKFAFNMQCEPIYNESDSEEVKKEKMEEFFRINDYNSGKGLWMISNEYIEDENGNRYYPTQGDSIGKSIRYEANGIILYNRTFDLVKYEDVSKIKLYFKLNLPNLTKDIVIGFERKT